jgi:carbon monoxide dehydrogenase subunit G
MGIALEQNFTLEASRGLVWALLTDPPRIVGCLPGAAITNRVDDRTYEGTMAVRVGPVSATYKGKVRFERLDAAAGQTELVAQGQETKGKGSAEMKMSYRIQPAGATGTQVFVRSDLTVTGILAQFGRGMIQEVADRMLQHFTGQMRTVLAGTKAKYAELVKMHAVQFAKLFPDKVGELGAAAGLTIRPDGGNTAASPEDLARYVEAVKRIGGDVSYTSARLMIRNNAQQANVPVPAL